MEELKYLTGYPEGIRRQAGALIREGRLGELLLKRYPEPHDIRTEKALYAFALEIKNRFLRTAPPLSKVVFDGKLSLVHEALGLHSFVSRVQGGRLKAKHEIRIGSLFRTVSLPFLRMIVVHELAHLRQKDHDKAFYQLCRHMEPDYAQIEFDLRLYLTQLELFGPLYS